ncbi:MAG: aminotransferase class IV [Polyangiaceae bacterium]|nr:aminotransferase class IV [Myxococcales bacterium]MCB9584305.1 aminotransferase class IV [Polyangiaceae bacterium]
MATLVSIDGNIVAPADAKVSVFDRGFLYGDSVFETIRTYDGKPYALNEHLERLARSAERVAIDLPVTVGQLRGQVHAVVTASNNPESYIRLMVTRGSGELGLAPDLAVSPLVVILVTPLTPPPAAAYADGISVITHHTRRATDSTLAEGAKVGNYLASVLAMKEAKARGAAEALILDADGHVVEGATSNLFLFRHDAKGSSVLVTPPESSGILAGITRAGVLEVARELGLRIEFEAPTLDDLVKADEVFISSSIRELLPVVRVDDQTLGDARPGPLTKRLHEAFREFVRRG